MIVCFLVQAFGAPLIVAEVDSKKEVFFGTDRFEVLANMIGKPYATLFITH